MDSDRNLLTCYRYIELNPVRAGMVADAGAYRWSSYHTNASGEFNPLITPHREYFRLGPDPESRRVAYREPFRDVISADRLAEIRAYVQQQRALGSPRFQAQIESMLGRCARVRPGRRPSTARRKGLRPGC